MYALSMIISGTWLQEADSISSGNSKLLMIFIGIVAFSMLVQAIAVIMVAIGAAKIRTKLLELIDEVKAKAMPAFEKGLSPMFERDAADDRGRYAEDQDHH